MKKKKVDPKKPEPRMHHEPAYDWHEVVEWVEHKTGRQLEDWAGYFESGMAEGTPYQDFWHHICDTNEVHNGCYIYVNLSLDSDNEPWINEVIQAIRDEFPDAAEEDEMYCYVAW